jgi:hypothetical protein
MSHSMHRAGNDEDLDCDYVVIARTEKGFNRDNSAWKIKEILRLFAKHGAIAIMGAKIRSYRDDPVAAALELETIIDSVKDGAAASCLFDSLEKLQNFLVSINEKDLGVSIVVSGLFDRVNEACQAVGIQPHTTYHSLGIWGSRSALPQGPALEIQTMCGHGYVSKHLIAHLVEEIRVGRNTVESAARELAKPCHCGIFNVRRAMILLKAIVEDPEARYEESGPSGWTVTKLPAGHCF